MSVEIADIKQIVEEAGQLALLYYGKVTKSIKADLSVVSEADEAVEDFLRLSLTSLAPGYGYIGEETDGSRPPAPGETHAWVVDALDGSRAFVAGMPLWMPAACLMDGNRPIAGAAVNPVEHPPDFVVPRPAVGHLLQDRDVVHDSNVVKFLWKPGSCGM